MRPQAPEAPLTVRLGARLGPEHVASLLVVVVVSTVLAVVFAGRQAAGVPPSHAASAAAIPSGAAIPSATAVVPSSRPNTTAGAILAMVNHLLDTRARLEAELAKGGTDSLAIADLLRDVTVTVAAEEMPLIELAADRSTADLAARIEAANAAIAEAAHRTQRESTTNVKAYRAGAGEVIAAMLPLPAIRDDLAAAAGERPATAPPSQADGSAEPSGVTP